ncbi:MAG: bifunctional precorrin-2 dehydrogenase/sirohydrochlorin ferrochelatase [Sulfolobaceae archaeon]
MENSGFLPIFIRATGLKVLVIGGGKVGSKRALKFANYGSRVTVISLDVSKELLENKENLDIVIYDARNLSEEFLKRFDIIVTATNDKSLNENLCTNVKKLRKLCNNPTNVENSSFIFPIFYDNNEVEVAITTFGKSSLTAKLILNRILNIINEKNIKNLLNVMGDVKKILKERIKDPSKRFKIYQVIFNDPLFERFIFEGDKFKAFKRAEEIISEYSRRD